MKITCDIKATEFTDEEIKDATIKSVESYLNKKGDILFNIPNSDMIHEIAENFSEAVLKNQIFDVSELKIKSHKLDDLEVVQANMIRALKKKLTESLVYIHFELMYKNMWPNINLKSEIEEINKSSNYVILYQSNEFVCFVTKKPIIFK